MKKLSQPKPIGTVQVRSLRERVSGAFFSCSPRSPGFKDMPKAEYYEMQGLTFNADSST